MTFTSPFTGAAEQTETAPLQPVVTQRRRSELYIQRKEAAMNIAMQNRVTEQDEDDF